MKEIIIDNLIMSYDDSFEILGEEETDQLKFYDDNKGICLKNEDKHLMITIGYKKINSLINLILSENNLIKTTQNDIARAMKKYDYQLIDYSKKIIKDKQAHGFSYKYIADDINMYGEAYVIKFNKAIYYLYLYSRSDNYKENKEIFDNILNQIEWKNKEV